MTDHISAHSRIIPAMRYRNASEAIEWLCRVFGFAKRAVYAGPDNSIMHAELTLGGGMLMLGSVKDDEYGRLMKQPDEIGGAETRGVNLTVDDADAVCRRAKDAGAAILSDVADKPYGGRGFVCRDLEGRIWHINTFDPWQAR